MSNDDNSKTIEDGDFENEAETSSILARKRKSDSDTTTITSATAKKANPAFDWSFLKDKGDKTQIHPKKKRDYGDKHVCLACVNNKNLKQKSIAILCRGTLHQLKRHYERQHCKAGSNSKCLYTNKSQFKGIVPLDHSSVPNYIRAIALSKTTACNSPVEVNKDLSDSSTSTPTLATPIAPNDSSGSTAVSQRVNEDLQDRWAPSPTEIQSDIDDPDEPPVPAREKRGSGAMLLQTGMESYVQISKPEFEEKMLGIVEKISIKLDNLSISNGSVCSSTQASSSLMSAPSDGFSEDMRTSYDKMKEWKGVKNIVELVRSVDCLTLYPLPTDEDMDGIFKEGGAILRCETCFTLHKDKARKLTPAKAARRLSSDCLSICTGKYLNPDSMAEMMSGQSGNWRKLKSRILQHMVCASDGQTHFKALTLISEEDALKKKHYEAAETLLKSALTAVKAKSAALHYESQIAFAFSVGGQVGQCGHSRKLFSDLLKSMLAVINRETKAKLKTCLVSTGLPPHFYLTVDKATVNKRSNQAVMICPILDGKRVPIAVAAPEVYTSKGDGNVEGGTLSESANQALEVLRNTYGNDVLDSLIGKSLNIIH